MSLRDLGEAVARARPNGPFYDDDEERLITLAPEMAALIADMADALEAMDFLCARSGMCADAHSLLARFSELDSKAGAA